jgi:hypothetical protein
MQQRIPNLTIEPDEDDGFLLSQDVGGNTAYLELHETQVRHLAELAGLLPRRDEPYTPPATVLARRLRVLLDRIDELDERLKIVASNGREDLEHELTYSFATWELAREFVADLESRDVTARHGDVTQRHGSVTPTVTPDVTPSSNGQLELVDGADGNAHHQSPAR